MDIDIILSCWLQTYSRSSSKENLSFSSQFSAINYGIVWRKDVVNQCLELAANVQGQLNGEATRFCSDSGPRPG